MPRGTLRGVWSEAVLARSPTKLEGRPRDPRTARENSDCAPEGRQGPADEEARSQGQRKGRAGDGVPASQRAQRGVLQAPERHLYLIYRDLGASLSLTHQRGPYDAENETEA